jgi:hypothetical protein
MRFRKSLFVSLIMSSALAGCTGFDSGEAISPHSQESGDRAYAASAASQQESARRFLNEIQTGQLPSSFGASLQNSAYNPVGPRTHSFVDGAREAYRIGLKTLKISMARETLTLPHFYSLHELEGVTPGEMLQSVHSLKDLAQTKAFRYVLAIPFPTLFIQTTEIGLSDPNSHYWTMAERPLTLTALKGIHDQHYDFAVYLLQRFRGSGRTFVLQDHEGDWHASLPIATGYSENTDIGQDNYLLYWRTRQAAIEKARRDIPSDVRVYNLCEVVRVRESLITGAKSLARDVLPAVKCDLVGYSAHDTALLPDDGQTLRRAIEYVRQQSQPSEAFGRNNVILSEIAVPELLNGQYIPRMTGVVGTIFEKLSQGMPWVLYWQMYDNETSGNWLTRPDGAIGLAFRALLDAFLVSERALLERPHRVAPFSQVSLPQWPAPSPTPGPSATPLPSPTPGGLKACEDQGLSVRTEPPVAGVHADIQMIYREVLGGIGMGANGVGDYRAGALYLTRLQSEGFTVESLRRDLANEKAAVESAISRLYWVYLLRPPHPTDLDHARAFIQAGGTLRQLERMILTSAECRRV